MIILLMLHLWHLYRYIFFIWKHYFLNFFHMFITSVVASSSISSVWFIDVVFFVIDMSSGLTTTLYMIFCYKFYYDFLWHVNYMSNLYEYIYLYFHMWKWYSIYIFYISDNFFICPDGYFSTNAFCLQFLNHFSLPDVASVIMTLVHIVSFLFLSVSLFLMMLYIIQ